MKTRKEFVAILLSIKGELETRFHVKSIGIFGSVARNENTDTSDLDLIVELVFGSTSEIGNTFVTVQLCRRGETVKEGKRGVYLTLLI